MSGGRHVSHPAPAASLHNFPWLDAAAMASMPEVYPWAYPVDAGYVTAWPNTIENPDPLLDWPYMYDPYTMDQGPIIVEGPAPGYAVGSLIPESLSQAGEQLGQGISRAWSGVSQAVGQGLEGLRQAAGDIPGLGIPSRIERKVTDVGDKTAQAADTVKVQANAVGDDARRTMAMMQASMVAANKNLEDASRKAQATADAIKYVALGVGGLATVALLFHIIKQSTE
jgi:hypothetical protein